MTKCASLNLTSETQTPLGFFTSFFGMNNALTGADWMSLGRQCLYMCKPRCLVRIPLTSGHRTDLNIAGTKVCISAVIILIALSLAFKSQLRQFIQDAIDPIKRAWSESKPVNEATAKEQNRMSRNAKYAGPIARRDEARSSEIDYSEVDSAKKYFGLVSRVGRSDHPRHDVENPGR